MTRNYSSKTNVIFGSDFFSQDMTYYLQKVNLPSLSINNIEKGSSRFGFKNFDGQTIDYGKLDMEFIVDAKLEVWKDLIKLFQSKCAPETGLGITQDQRGSWVKILDGNNNEILTVTFSNCMIHELGELEYIFNNSGEENMTVKFSLLYDLN